MQHTSYVALCAAAAIAMLLAILLVPAFFLSWFFEPRTAQWTAIGLGFVSMAVYYVWGVPALANFFVWLHRQLWPDFKEAE